MKLEQFSLLKKKKQENPEVESVEVSANNFEVSKSNLSYEKQILKDLSGESFNHKFHSFNDFYNYIKSEVDIPRLSDPLAQKIINYANELKFDWNTDVGYGDVDEESAELTRMRKELFEKFNQSLDSNKNTYVTRLRLELLNSDFDTHNINFDVENIYKITNDQYVDRRRVTDKKDFKKVSTLLSELKGSPEERQDLSFWSSALDRKPTSQQEELSGYFKHYLSDEIQQTEKGFVGPWNEVDKDISDFEAVIISKPVRDFIKKDLNINLEDLTLPEQFNFLSYAKNTTIDKIHKIKSFSGAYGSSGVRTFLSLEHSENKEEMGNKILTLGEKFPEDSAKKLFAKYGEIVNEVDNIAEYLNKSLGEKVNPELVGEAKNNLLIKGKEMLARYAKDAEECKGQKCVDLGIELEEKIKDIKTSLVLFASACKTLSEQGLLSFEDLANTRLDVVRGVMPIEDQQDMMRIFKENRPSYSPELLADSISEFEDALKNPKENQTWFILRNNVNFPLRNTGDMASFMRLDEYPDYIYGASFNVRTELRGSSIGSELLKKIIEEKSSVKPFKIVCYDKNPMLKKYIEDFGFQITGTIENYHDTGETFYEMMRSSKSK